MGGGRGYNESRRRRAASSGKTCDILKDGYKPLKDWCAPLKDGSALINEECAPLIDESALLKMNVLH